MRLTSKIQRAIDLVSKLHLGQMRKSDPELPYISHLFSVAWILSSYTQDEDVIVAGLLHDVLEDVKGYYYSDLVKDFGPRVADIVKEVSEDNDPNDESGRKMPWKECKEKYIEGLKKDGQEALMVSAADKIHNLQTMTYHYKNRGEDLWNSFSAPKEEQLWFYEEVFKVLESRLENEIMNQYREELNNFRKKVVKSEFKSIKENKIDYPEDFTNLELYKLHIDFYLGDIIDNLGGCEYDCDIDFLDNWIKDKNGEYYFYDGHNYYNSDGSCGSVPFHDYEEEIREAEAYQDMLDSDSSEYELKRIMSEYALDEVDANDILSSIEDGMEEETAIELSNN